MRNSSLVKRNTPDPKPQLYTGFLLALFAEVQMKLEALQRDDDVLVPPSQFQDPALYQRWKVEELQRLSDLVTLFGNLPSFSGGVQVEILSGEDLKPTNTSCTICSLPAFNTKPAEISVYCSVSILPATRPPVTTPSPASESSEADGLHNPVFLSEVVVCTGNADWQTQSPWTPITRYILILTQKLSFFRQFCRLSKNASP
jgi:hypothetical protein